MKVTMVTRGSPDYLPDIVADGLIRKLGRENVHLVTGISRSKSPMLTQICQGYEIPNVIGCYDTDALVISCRSGLGYLEDWVKNTGRRTVASLDGEDDATLRADWVSASKVHFKREYLTGRAYGPKVLPLPFGAIPELIPAPGTRKGVFFRNRQNDPVRVAIVKELARLGFPIPQNEVSKEVYNRELSESLVGVSARGAGWDTYRYWEVPYFGTLLFTQKMGIVIPDNFKEGVEAVVFDSAGDFAVKLQAVLSDPKRAAEIALAGQRACHSRHLSIHRADRVLQALM
jgi:glycosyl transferase family 1